MSEQEQEGASPTVTRSQHVVLQGAPDRQTMAAAMRPGMARSRGQGSSAAPACLVITPTRDLAILAADVARELLGDGTDRVVPISGIARARRVLAAAPLAVACGTPTDLLALRRDAALRMDALTTMVFLGLDDLLGAGSGETLQALLGDTPSGMGRVATRHRASEASDAFLEAQLPKARRLAVPTVATPPMPLVPQVILTSDAGKGEMLRLLLDEVDPPSLAIVATTDAGQQAATAALARLGVSLDGEMVQVVAHPATPHLALVVLWDLPASADALAALLAVMPAQAVAMVRPDELPTLREFVGGSTTPWVPAVRKAAAGDKVQRVRNALRQTLDSAPAAASELALLAPLLDSYDPLDLACAALRLLEGVRREAATPPAPMVSSGPVDSAPPRAMASTSSRAGTGDRDARSTAPRSGAPRGAAPRGAAPRGRGNERSSERGGEWSGSRGAPRSGPRDRDRGPDREGERSARPSARPERGADRGAPRGGAKRFGASADREAPRGRGPARPGGRDSFRDGPREGPRGPARGGAGRPPRAGEERRAFGDRPPRERTEGRAEWAERGDRLARAKRPARRPSAPGDEG